MIERQIVKENIKEYKIEEYITKNLKNVGHSHTKILKTPIGEKIIIHAASPGLIVGRKGANIKKLTETLKNVFKLENPQIEISEVEIINLDANIVAEKIASYLERFGTKKFKGIGHMILSDVMGAGAMGVEVVISGKIPSARAKSWRFYQGYLKKSGDIAQNMVKKSYATAKLKTGIVGIKVSIMTPDIKLPDKVNLVEGIEAVTEEVKEEPKKVEKKPKKRTRKPRKEAGSKKEEIEIEKKEESKVEKNEIQRDKNIRSFRS